MSLQELPRNPRSSDKHTFYAVRDGITLADLLQDVPDQKLVCLGSKFAGGFFAALPKESVLEAYPEYARIEVLEIYDRFLGGIAILLKLAKVGQWDCKTVPWTNKLASKKEKSRYDGKVEDQCTLLKQRERKQSEKEALAEQEKQRRRGYKIAVVTKLRCFLEQCCVSKKAFAEEVGAASCTVSDWCTGKRMPRYEIAQQVDKTIDAMRKRMEGDENYDNRRPA